MNQQIESTADPSLLNLERIFMSGEFQQDWQNVPIWSEELDGYYQIDRNDKGYGLVLVDVPSNNRKAIADSSMFIPEGETKPLVFNIYLFSRNQKYIMVAVNPRTNAFVTFPTFNYWVLETASARLWQLGPENHSGRLMDACFSPDCSKVTYISERNVFVEDLDTGECRQMTSDGNETFINGNAPDLFGCADAGIKWSPDSKAIAYIQFDISKAKTFKIRNYDQESNKKIKPFIHPRPGEDIPATSIAITQIETGETVRAMLPGAPDNHYIFQLIWHPDNREVWVQQVTRDRKSLNVISIDSQTGVLKTILTEREETWVEPHSLIWFNEGRNFIWMSERDGWTHIYNVSKTNGRMKLLTPGAFDVESVEAVDEKNNRLYFRASMEDYARRYLYTVDLHGEQGVERVTPAELSGWSNYRISPRFNYAFHSYQNFETPLERNLIEFPGHKKVKCLLDNTQVLERLKKLKRSGVEFFSIEIEKGLSLEAWCMTPPDFSPGKKYPLLLNVYGEPAAQTVLDAWWGESNLWYILLSQMGYVVMSIDNRGTPALKGKAWRRIIYKQQGLLPADDQARALRKLLEQRPYIDPDRIGVYGWSGSGCLSLLLIFRYPELYKVAMAGAGPCHPKINHLMVVEKYLGRHQEDPDAYEKTAPLTYAENLKGKLLIAHGLDDESVVIENTETLVEKLVNLGKQFTMMAYPNAGHFLHSVPPTNYHLHALYLDFLKQHLPVT